MATVLEGFLVKLGFDVDKDQMAKFNGTVQDAGKRFISLSKAGIAAGMTLGAAFTKATADVNKLYNVSNNAGVSIKGLKSFQGAVEAVGGSAEAVTGAFQQFALNTKTFAGFGDLIRDRLGVSMVDTAGNARDMSDVFLDITRSLQKMAETDPGLARMQAEAIGLGGIFDDIMKKDFAAELERVARNSQMLDSGFESSADSAHRFMNEISSTMDIVGNSFMSLSSQLVDALDLDDKLSKVNKGLADWFHSAISTEIAIVKDSDGVFDWLGKWLFKADEYHEKVTEQISASKEVPKLEAKPQRDKAVLDDRFAKVRGFRNNNPGNMRVGPKMIGKDSGGFARFATMEQGYGAMASQLKAYNNAGLDNVASIVRKWAPASENDVDAYVDSVVRSMTKQLGTDMTDRSALDLSNPQVLKALTDAMITHENGAGASAYFQGSAFDAEIAKAAQSTRVSKVVGAQDRIPSTSVVQNIYINGSGNPEAVAQNVTRETERTLGRASQRSIA